MDSAYHFMEILVKEVGNRESGTESEREAARLIKGLFEEFGLSNVRLHEFDVTTTRVLKEEAFSSDGRRLNCAAVGNSISTPPEGVEGEIVLLEGTSHDMLRKIENKIAVINVALTKEKFLKIVKAKPQALVFASSTPFAPTVYRSIMAEWTEKENVPAVTISHDDLLSVIKGSRKLRIVTEMEQLTARSQNVVGEVPGEIEDEDILVGGHYDTVRKVLGAHDNAGGIAVVLELARIFADEKLNRTLKFAAFGSEELGLRGSLNFAQNEHNIKNLRFYLNLDVHGNLLGTQVATILGPEDLKAFFCLIAKEIGIPVDVTSKLGRGGSDHMSLALYGVPSVMLSRAGGANRIMHTILDDDRWCGPEAFSSVGRLTQTLLRRLVNASEFPFDKEIPPDIAKALDKRFKEWIGFEKRSKKEDLKTEGQASLE